VAAPLAISLYLYFMYFRPDILPSEKVHIG
jgi:hypothetical protein